MFKKILGYEIFSGTKDELYAEVIKKKRYILFLEIQKY